MKIRCINDYKEFKKGEIYYMNEDSTISCYIFTDLSINHYGYRFYYYHYFKDIIEKDENDGYNFRDFRIFEYYFDNRKEMRKRKLKKIKENYGD